MKRYLLLTLLFSASYIYAQTDDEIDVLTKEMCKTINENNTSNDSIRIDYTYKKHLPAFFEKHKAATEEEFKSAFNKIYFRFQKNCNTFSDILSRSYSAKGEWKILQSAPKNNLTEKICRDITSIKKFYYLENDGATVNVLIENGFWKEEFEDGSYSKLYFRWKSDCEFELEFIESNNHMRKNFSVKGNKYHYGLYNTINGAYEMWVKTENGTFQATLLHPGK